MRYTLIIIFCALLSQYIFAQYRSSCFTFDETDSQYGLSLNAAISIEDSTIRLPNIQSCSGLFVSGNVQLKDSIDGYARITLKDYNDFEYLVYEIYPMLADSSSINFSKTGLESSVLNQIQPKSIRIETRNASMLIDSVYFVFNNSPSRTFLSRSEVIRDAQCEYIAQKLNNQLESKGKTWRGGTTSVSNLTYQEKKDMFGGRVPILYGFDYYKEGVFVMPEFEKTILKNELRTGEDLYVDEWDWRNRHGKNWMSPVKSQGGCGSCWAFAAVGTFESYINLYYNQLLNFNLSEQELLSCSTAGNCSGGYPDIALNYIKNHGIIPEDCFAYTASVVSCDSKCDNPEDVLSLSSYSSISYNDVSLKQSIINAPIVLSIIPWTHSIVCCGFKTIQSGDYCYDQNCGLTAISDDNPLIGHPAWLIKNSWGSTWGMNGYGYVAVSPSQFYYTYKVSGKVTSLVLSDDDVVCEDADGDGLYYWGVGSKPTSCPSWVPDEEDGDDSDYTKGPIDEYGFLQDIIPDQMDTIYIDQNTEYASIDFTTPRHILVRNNSTLTVSNHLTCYSGVSLTIEAGSKLSVSGGILDDVILKLLPGGEVTLSNNGTIIHSKSQPFTIPKGAFLNQNSGVIR